MNNNNNNYYETKSKAHSPLKNVEKKFQIPKRNS